MTLALALEYLKAVLTWPVAAVVIVLLLRAAIRDLLARIASVKFPGGELQTRQPSEAGAGNAQVNTPAPPLPAGLTLQPHEQDVLRQAFQAEHAAARLWEYRYLNLFLVPVTQRVLDWFVGLGPVTTFDVYEAYWSQFITDVGQRKVIFDVLTSHHLVQPDGPILLVSDKGREYQTWRGPLPLSHWPPSRATAPPGP